MKYCSKCVLSDKLFSVTIGDDGLCNYCRIKTTDNKTSQPLEVDIRSDSQEYDILLAYSGGKDSTYTLYLLKEKYNLNVLAVTFDNGFLTDETYCNIRKVCSNLDVDSVIVAPSTQKLNKIFKYSIEDDSLPKKSLERASSICTYCISLVKMQVYKEAMLRKIPYIAFGWTPGQIKLNKQTVKLDYSILKSNFSGIQATIIREFGEDYRSVLLTEEQMNEYKDRVPSLFYPFMNDNYDEEQMVKKIQEFGWKKPVDTDQNSTNCILNMYAIHKHKEKYGFHPYALELAYLVRNNLMDREVAMKRLNEEEDIKKLQYIEKQLGITSEASSKQIKIK